MTTEEQIDQLKEQLARALTDNEALTEQNAKLHDEAQAARKQVQEMGDFNNLLVGKVQRLESESVELGNQRDRFKEGFEKYGRKIEELTDRLNRQKLLEKEPVNVVNG